MPNAVQNFIRLSKQVLSQKSFAKVMFDKSLLNNPKFDEWEADLFTRLRMSNGTAKMTFANRMPELDAYTTKQAKKFGEPVQIQDVGISSGISTYEWFQSLAQSKRAFNLVGGDAFIEARYGSYLNKNINILCEPNGFLLEADFFGLNVSSAQKKYGYIWFFWFFPIIDFIFRWRGKKIVQNYEEVQLVSQHLSNHHNIKTVKDDVLADNPFYDNQFHIIRAANIINLSYFNDEQIKRIILNLKKRLQNNGLLIINRTNYENKNNGNVYQLQDDKLVSIHQFGEGSEVNDFVLATNG